MRNIVWLLTVVSALLLSGCADAGKDQKANVGDVVTLDGSASKAKYGFTIVKYQWKQIRGEHVEIVDDNESIAHFMAVDMGKKKRSNFLFELTTVEKVYWGQTIKFRDRVNIMVEKPSNTDTVPPVITLNGDVNITLKVGDTYTEEGARATDDKDGNVSIVIKGTVDTSKAGIYTVTYSAKDSAGNEATATRTVTVQKSILTSLTLDSNTSTLHVGEQVSFNVTGTYSDGNTKKVDENITWIISPSDSLENNGTAFVATKEGNVTVKAKINDMVSNALKLNITLVINGYILPPEPDPAINNSTLLGVDSNDNGVRDDVERYIVKRYAQDPKYPKTKTAIALQYAWASQKILENPTIESKKYIDDAIDCQYYWLERETENLSGFEFGKFARQHEVFNDPDLKDEIYNTRQRIEQKFGFNASLSGNIFDGRERSISNCRTNINEIGE